MRPLVGTSLVTALALAACGSGSVEVLGVGAAPGEPATTRGAPTGWDRAIIEGTGSSLTLEFVGGGKGSMAEPAETTTTSDSVAELSDEGRLHEWVGSVRFEPWYEGFQFERTDEGLYGVVALNPGVDPPDLPADLLLRSVVSRMGQQEWGDLLPSLTDEMETLGVVGLAYNPFDDLVTVSRRREPPGRASEADVADRVRTLLGDSFDDIEIVFDAGTGTDFESPATTR